ncbi:MAG TPA: glycosyltransferase family 4 protein [Methylomirabilota bacterium]|nr:glycosyltransferase family 4 protein [Methylomirabilota bacterium]
MKVVSYTVRIGIIKNNFLPSGGGSERYTTQLIGHLRDRGHSLRVFASRWNASAHSSGVTLQPIRVPPGPPFLRLLAFARNCRAAVLEGDCDLVFSIERTIHQDIVRAGGGCHREWLVQRGRYCSWPRRLTFSLNPFHRTTLWLERRTFSPGCTRRVIANSHRGKSEIVRHYGFPKDRIDVVHNGTDCNRFTPRKRNGERRETVLLLVGSGFERKGLAFALRALAKLPTTVRLEVAGKGNPGPYRRLAARLGVGDRLTFLGTEAKIEAVYARGDILVHPAIYEPFSNACLEAMACGLPVVTSRINGASELVEPGINGTIVDEPADSDELSAAIRHFLDRDSREAASQAARRTGEAHPFSRNVEETLEVIRGLCDSGRG